MSRSYKKTPYCGDPKGKFEKQSANAKVRRYLKNSNNELKRGNYKKLFETWDICDYGWTQSWEEYWKKCMESYHKFPTLYKNHPPNKREEYRNWYKYYKMK